MYLYGASGHAKVIIDILKASGIQIDGLVDDNPNIVQLQGYPVFHEWMGLSPFIVSIGANNIRKMVAEKLSSEFGTAIHPSAIISSSAVIDKGTVVMQGAIIQTDVKVGKHCNHECMIEEYVHISPHATLCGNVHIGEGSWIGAGTTVIPGVKVGKWCIVGAGSVVTKDIPDRVLAVGNRCKIIKSL